MLYEKVPQPPLAPVAPAPKPEEPKAVPVAEPKPEPKPKPEIKPEPQPTPVKKPEPPPAKGIVNSYASCCVGFLSVRISCTHLCCCNCLSSTGKSMYCDTVCS